MKMNNYEKRPKYTVPHDTLKNGRLHNSSSDYNSSSTVRVESKNWMNAIKRDVKDL